MSKNWIQTLETRKLVPAALTKEMVGSIEEIAHSLSGNFRFTRQTKRRYTVAQHCVLGARLLSPVFGAAFLLHELSETYLPDVNSPTKPDLYVEVTGKEDAFARIPGGATFIPFDRAATAAPALRFLVKWSTLEAQHVHVMLDALGLLSLEPLIYSPEVKAMDRAMLAAEKDQLFDGEPEPWEQIAATEPAEIGTLTVWDPDTAEREFLAEFRARFSAPWNANCVHAEQAGTAAYSPAF